MESREFMRNLIHGKNDRLAFTYKSIDSDIDYTPTDIINIYHQQSSLNETNSQNDLRCANVIKNVSLLDIDNGSRVL